MIAHLHSLFTYFAGAGGIIERIHDENDSGFRVWIYTVPGPRKRHTSPSPDVKLSIIPLEALSILYVIFSSHATR